MVLLPSLSAFLSLILSPKSRCVRSAFSFSVVHLPNRLKLVPKGERQKHGEGIRESLALSLSSLSSILPFEWKIEPGGHVSLFSISERERCCLCCWAHPLPNTFLLPGREKSFKHVLSPLLLLSRPTDCVRRDTPRWKSVLWNSSLFLSPFVKCSSHKERGKTKYWSYNTRLDTIYAQPVFSLFSRGFRSFSLLSSPPLSRRR